MQKRGKGAGAVLCCLVLIATSCLYGLRGAAAQEGVGWPDTAPPALIKLSDLPISTSPTENNTSCSPYTYTPVGSQSPTGVCTFGSPLGTLSEQGGIQTGPDAFVRLTGPSTASFFIPAPDPSVGVVALPSTQTGNNVGIYSQLSKADLKFNPPNNGGAFYSITKSPDKLIRNSLTGSPLQFNAASAAFSGNGQWMVVDMPHQGLMRVRMSDLSTLLFAGPIEPNGYSGTATVPMAVSNDGRYVAANPDVFGSNDLAVYDLATCTDQLNVLPIQAHYCTGRDIWHGKGSSVGLLAANPDLQLPSHLQFIADGGRLRIRTK